MQLGDVDEMHRLLSASLRGCPHWRTTFCAQRAIASISREKSWKAAAKKHQSWRVVKSRCKKSISVESRCKKYSCFSFATLAAWREKYPAKVALLLQSRMDFFSQSRRVYWVAEFIEPQSLLSRGVYWATLRFSRRAAEFIEPQSYCFWELEHAERPSVLGEVHRDEPTPFSHYLLVRSIFSPQTEGLSAPSS